MKFLVKVRVNLKKMPEFGQKLQKNELNRTMIKSETYCIADDPAVGYSVWEAENRKAFDSVFSAWKQFYAETEIIEVVSAQEAMGLLFAKNKK